MNKSTVIPALIGIGVALLLILVVGGVIFAVNAVQTMTSQTGSSSSSSDEDDESDESSADEEDTDDADPGSSSDPIDGLTIGTGEITIVGYFDFACPICASFVDTNGEQIAGWVDDGSVTLEVHPVSILDANSSTEYSTRAAAAFACEADINPDLAFDYLFELFDSQPAEQGEGLSDKELANLADNLGGDSIVDCIMDGDRLDWVTTTTDQALDDGLTGTPWILVNGEQYDGARDDDMEFATFLATVV